MIKKIIIASTLLSQVVFASSYVELNVNSNTVEIAGQIDIKNSFELKDNSNYYWTLSALSSKKDNGYQTSSKLFKSGVKVLNPYLTENGLKFGLGLNLAIADNTDAGFISLPLSAFGVYEINENFSVNADISYAPSVLTFRDGSKYSDYSIKANYQVLPNAYAFVGARAINTTYDNASVKFDDSLFVGYKVQF